MVTSQYGTTSLKHEVYWSKDEDNETLSNDKALNAIFNGVDKNMLRLINIFSRLLMKAHSKCVCQSCNSLQLTLKIWE